MTKVEMDVGGGRFVDITDRLRDVPQMNIERIDTTDFGDSYVSARDVIRSVGEIEFNLQYVPPPPEAPREVRLHGRIIGVGIPRLEPGPGPDEVTATLTIEQPDQRAIRAALRPQAVRRVGHLEHARHKLSRGMRRHVRRTKAKARAQRTVHTTPPSC